MPRPNLTHIARSKSAIILAFFGATWLLAWRYQMHSATPVVLLVIVTVAALIGGAAFLQVRRLRQMGLEISAIHSGRSLRLYGFINMAQWLLIFAVAAVFGSTGHPQWISAASILIVGLHFFPLAHVFKDRLHYFTGVSLVLLACFYPVLSKLGPEDPIGLLGAGVILWVSAIAAIAANDSFMRRPLLACA